ncbi:Ig heavy chain Mem5-like [Myiozetetes cayanensis]|uniref:Ig heavy chain Mem5-like n=1 Tax=Myiozetetes cayanensis TaxID=478635 RepID=UPI00215EC36A|nr:Ig heavy chain Mem5-like [Myiozetetes cayanensis]
MWAGLGPWLLGLALALGPAGLWAQMRLEEAGGALRAPGESVLLSCRGSGFTFENHYVRWYRQAPGAGVEWVSWISHYSSQVQFGPAVEGRATASRDNSLSEASLSLHLLHAGDGARYFCAVCTETQNQLRTAALVFGKGTQLTVEPSSPKPSVPQVIVMKSKKLKEGGSPGKAACLATNFSTRRISLEMSSAEVVYEQSTPILTAQGFYSAMKVVNVTKDTEVTCKAHFDTGTLTALPEKEAEEPVTRTSNRVCNSTDTPAQGPTVQRVNTLSMAVLGLRVLLAKSIAFNTLMSIKLVLF